MAKRTAAYIEVKQGSRRFLLTRLTARTLAAISYAAVRGQSSEVGAIQRILNNSRIGSIKDFAIAGGDFPNAIVLNWVKSDNPIYTSEGRLTFEVKAMSAQIIDGQHRVAGLREAIEENKTIGKLEVPVVIYDQLSTKECADLFLAINTEQKPVPRSLVFDLYGIASEDLVDPAAMRARDIATFLNEDEDSPYNGEIKFPGQKSRRGGIALSTAVSAIKPLVNEKGTFEQLQIYELEIQRKVVLNMFIALQRKYKSAWDEKSNAFKYAAGFMGAMEFLQLKLIPYCSVKMSFTTETIETALHFNENELIVQEDTKGLSGSSAAKHVYEKLLASFVPEVKPTKFTI
ncbi:DGQHR domain-containing protein [Xanthomonas arboricola]